MYIHTYTHICIHIHIIIHTCRSLPRLHLAQATAAASTRSSPFLKRVGLDVCKHRSQRMSMMLQGDEVDEDAKNRFNALLLQELDEDQEVVGWTEGDVDVDGLEVLPVCVDGEMYEVMTGEVGMRGEKGVEYRMDNVGKRPYWTPRLKGRRYDRVKVYCGTHVPNESAAWTMFRWDSTEEAFLAGDAFTAGPYSNGAARTFSVRAGVPLFIIHLGVITGRHYANVPASSDICYLPPQGSPATALCGAFDGSPRCAKESNSQRSPSPVRFEAAPSHDDQGEGDQGGVSADAIISALVKHISAVNEPVAREVTVQGLKGSLSESVNAKLGSHRQALQNIINNVPGKTKQEVEDLLQQNNKELKKQYDGWATKVADALKTSTLDSMQSSINKLAQLVEDRCGSADQPRSAASDDLKRSLPKGIDTEHVHTHSHKHAKYERLIKEMYEEELEEQVHTHTHTHTHTHARAHARICALT